MGSIPDSGYSARVGENFQGIERLLNQAVKLQPSNTDRSQTEYEGDTLKYHVESLNTLEKRTAPASDL